MGFCLGSQLLCKAAGGDVVKSPAKEIGWFPVNLTPEGLEDPLFAGLPPRFPVFQWHGDMFVPPRDSPFGDATRLAVSELVPQQALRVGKRAYGLQFHIEITPDMVVDWTNEYQEEAANSELAQPIDEMRRRAYLNESLMKERSRRIYDNFRLIANL